MTTTSFEGVNNIKGINSMNNLRSKVGVGCNSGAFIDTASQITKNSRVYSQAESWIDREPK